jgi:hypothetical protein
MHRLEMMSANRRSMRSKNNAPMKNNVIAAPEKNYKSGPSPASIPTPGWALLLVAQGPGYLNSSK